MNTEKHKEKLLEMCKVLFPEWKAYSLMSNDQYISDDTKEFSESDETFKIHWFEFCMTHLANKIYYHDNNNKKSTRAKVEYFFFQSFIDTIEGATSGYDHPVDYLYKEFKKIKL